MVAIDDSLQLDIEFGNADGYYSASASGDLIDYRGKDDSSIICESWYPSLARTDVRIDERIELGNVRFLRRVCFTLNGKSSFFDLVSRFVVWSKDDRPGVIADRKIVHTSSNIYYQHNVDNAFVPIGRTGYLKFTSKGITSTPGFEPVFYIRDECRTERGYKWIVHHRVIVSVDEAELIVRSCHPRLEGPLPCQWLIPKYIKKYLFRIRERSKPNFPVMAVGEIELKGGTLIGIETEVCHVDNF